MIKDGISLSMIEKLACSARTFCRPKKWFGCWVPKAYAGRKKRICLFWSLLLKYKTFQLTEYFLSSNISPYLCHAASTSTLYSSATLHWVNCRRWLSWENAGKYKGKCLVSPECLRKVNNSSYIWRKTPKRIQTLVTAQSEPLPA